MPTNSMVLAGAGLAGLAVWFLPVLVPLVVSGLLLARAAWPLVRILQRRRHVWATA